MNTNFFMVDLNKIKHLYEVQNDKTAADKFIIKLKKEFGDTILAISIKGLSAGNNKFNFKQNPYGFDQMALLWQSSKIDQIQVREYYLKLYINYNKVPFRICNMEWIQDVDSRYQKGTEEDFNYNVGKAYWLIEKFFKKHTKYFKVSVFCGLLPQSTWSTRCYLKVIIKLPVKGIDVFMHSGISNLSGFGLNYKEIVKREFCEIVNSQNYEISRLFNNKNEREKIARKAENNVRNNMGLKNVGDAFVNETLLANITEKLFPDTIRQYRTGWLGNFIIDIFVPSLNFAIEYNGIQHYMPIDRFGGEDKLLKQKDRDEYVRKKCKENNVQLLEWHYSIPVTEKNVYKLYSKYIDLRRNKN